MTVVDHDSVVARKNLFVEAANLLCLDLVVNLRETDEQRQGGDLQSDPTTGRDADPSGWRRVATTIGELRTLPPPVGQEETLGEAFDQMEAIARLRQERYPANEAKRSPEVDAKVASIAAALESTFTANGLTNCHQAVTEMAR